MGISLRRNVIHLLSYDDAAADDDDDDDVDWGGSATFVHIVG